MSPEIDDQDIAGELAHQEIRHQLQWRINTRAHPSRLINQIALADLRCAESTKTLIHLIGRSPKVLSVIRTALRTAFKMHPDNLLFTESMPPPAPVKVDTLTDRALLLLVKPSVDLNINSFTTLSVKGDSNRQLPFTPLEVLKQVVELGLSDRLTQAHQRYWGTLVEGSWLTRQEHWAELHAGLFADRAFIARQLDELSSAGMLMVQAVVDAPTAEARRRAGGRWAQVQVSLLMWPGTPAVAVPGALHFYREGDPADVPHVLYLPGVVRNFYEYPTFAALQCGLLLLAKERFHLLWQCLPLDRRNRLCPPADLSAASGFTRGRTIADDALAQSALALLEGQWANEMACAFTINLAHVFSVQRPAPLEAVPFLKFVEGTREQLIGGVRLGRIRDQLLKWDHQRRRAEVTFGSIAPGLALRTVEYQVKRYEKGLAALLAAGDPAAPTPAYQEFLSLISQWEVHVQALKALMKDSLHWLIIPVFWSERPGGPGTPRRVSQFMTAQTEALRCEVQLQHRLKLLGTGHRDLMIEVIDQPLARKRPGSQTRVLSIAIGNEPDAFFPLHNLWVVTTVAALNKPIRQLPVVLYAFGRGGGVMAFAGLEALTRSLKASLASRDDSILWSCVERDKRHDLRAQAMHETLAVRYVPIQGKPALVSIKKLLFSCDRLYKSPDKVTRIFSEVKDIRLSRALLMAELEQQLQVPVNSALDMARKNIELLRQVALEAKKLPSWLTQATRSQRKQFRHLHRRYLNSSWAFLARQEQRLPDLNTYARQALAARLRSERIFPRIGFDEPFIAMSGDIHGTYCGYEEARLLKDAKNRLSSSSSCRAFSLLELALHNLDPQANWTQYKLNRAYLLQVPWIGFHVNHLRQIIASMDIGGRYDALIKQVFYPPAHSGHSLTEERIPELLDRTLRTGAQLHLFSAAQEGLSAKAQSVFSTAMAARAPQDLLKNQHELRLHVVHWVGHTMQHDRYVAGIVVVQDKRSQLCLIYWPQAPQALVLTEYSSLEKACAELNRLGALPDNTRALARQVSPGWAFQAEQFSLLEPESFNVLDLAPGSSHVKGGWRASRAFSAKHQEPSLLSDEIETQMSEQIGSHPTDWLEIVASASYNAQALLYRAHVHDLQRQTQAASYSKKALDDYRIRRLRDDGIAKRRMVLGIFVPIFGMLNSIHELYLAARRYQKSGDLRDKRALADATKYFVVDLVMTFVPSPFPTRAGVAARSAIRSALPSALERIRRWRVKPGVARPPSFMRQLPELECFKVKSVPNSAVALKGPGEKGVYVKDGKLFVEDGTHQYPVYRRNNEPFFRLKNQQVEGADELILNIHEPGEWLLGADAPQPVAGTSSGVLSPWHRPVSAPPDWWPPDVRTTTERSILQSTNPASHWLNWRVVAPADIRQLTYPAPGIVRVPGGASGPACNLAHIAPPNVGIDHASSGFYRVLPEGSQAPYNSVAFITADEPLASRAFTDIERWTGTALQAQPLPMSYTRHSGWMLHMPLFDRPLAQSVGEAFPTMTIKSREFTAARLVELSGPPGSATATHLLNIRATLDTWLPSPPALPGQTDDLLRMLRPVERSRSSFYIGYDGAAPGLTRVDFQWRDSDPSLRIVTSRVSTERSTAMVTAVENVLRSQGFTIHPLNTVRVGKPSLELAATHPGSNSLYYLSLHWVERGHIRLKKRMSTDWFGTTIRNNANNPAYVPIKSALDEGRLVRIFAGIQWPIAGTLPPTVYFAKVGPS